MAIDTPNKRRSVAGTPPRPNADINASDRIQIAVWYCGLAQVTLTRLPARRKGVTNRIKSTAVDTISIIVTDRKKWSITDA